MFVEFNSDKASSAYVGLVVNIGKYGVLKAAKIEFVLQLFDPVYLM